MSKKVLIVGDSWGMGEWGNLPSTNSYGLRHKGIEEYLLSDGYIVENISQSAFTPKMNVDKLKKYQDLYTYDNIIFYLSGIFRIDEEISNITDMDSLFKLHDEIVEHTFEKLNNLGVRILLLGGLTKIPGNLSKYENLISVIDSIVEYLTPLEQYIYVNDVSYQINIDSSIELVNYLHKCNEMWDSLKNYEDFVPDEMHPNRNGIYKYYQEIKKHLI